MGQIYDSLKGLMTQARMSKAAETLSEDTKNVSDSAAVILPMMLGLLAKKGDTDRITDSVMLGGKLQVLKDLDLVYEGHGVIDKVNVGERMENALLEGEKSDLISSAASALKIDKEKVERLSNWVAATIAAYFGDKIVNGGAKLPALLNDLCKEKSDFGKDIPANIASKLGLVAAAATTVNATAKTTKVPTPQPKKKKFGWIWWLLAILAILAIFCCWRSCNKKRAMKANIATEQIIAATPIAAVATAINSSRPLTLVALPDGTEINVFDKGTECRMVEYLNSDAYKSATLDDFKKNWFKFDNIEFKHDSATEFMDGSESSAQLNNIAKILETYPAAKITIAGYADKTGGDAVNVDISKKRADFIKTYLVRKGVKTERISTEGFGEEFATHSASAPDSERALDRDIVLMFNK